MDEGAVVAYAARVLDGAVPHRDFLTFYGPGNAWVVAGAFAAFGESVLTERLVGLGYRLVIVMSLFVLGTRVSGLLGGVLAALVAAPLMAHEVIWAYATYGAIAFGLLSLALLAAGAARVAGRGQELLFLGAGIAAGIGVLIRVDSALAVVSALPLLAFVTWRPRLAYAGGLLAMLSILAVHLVIVGYSRVERVLGDLVASAPGRSLPLPEPSSGTGRMLAAGAVATLLLVVVGAIVSMRFPSELRGRVVLGAGLFAAALIPWTLSRPDIHHVRPLAVVALSMLPAVGLYAVSRLRLARGARVAGVVVIAALSLSFLLGVVRDAAANVRDLRGIRDAEHSFYGGESDPARAVVARADRLTKPGESLFVGPQDLRRTNYGPTYMYFLLRKLEPASYYMEMNPLTANRAGSGLADDLSRSDWLILTTKWDDWDEPNDSSKLGPTEPNDVVRDSFCVRFESEEYRLYERCERGERGS